MDTVNEEPDTKKPKTDHSKCANCKSLFRKGLKKGKEIKTHIEGEEFTRDYEFHVQVGDIICVKCFLNFRIKKSKKNREDSMVNLAEPMIAEVQDKASSSTAHQYNVPLSSTKESYLRDDSKCAVCKVYFRKGLVSKVKEIKTRMDAEKFTRDYKLYVQVGDIICNKCFSKYRAMKSTEVSENTSLTEPLVTDATFSIKILSQTSDEEVNNLATSSSQISNQFQSTSSSTTLSQVESQSSEYSPSNVIESDETETVVMPFQRVAFSKEYCFICKSKEDIHDVPFEARIQVFVKRRIFIPKRNRCCSRHIIKNRFYDDEIKAMTVYSNECTIEVAEVNKFIHELSDDVDARLHDKIRNYKISEERIKAFTGHTWDTIIMLRDMMPTMRDSDNRTVLQALVIFLFKLRSGNSDKLIAATLEITEEIVRDSIHSVLKCFREHVLPKNFGVHAHPREFFLDKTAKAARLLYDLGDSLAIICDGTYLRHEKSENNTYQRKSFSGQKKTPLCKPFTICTTNGYIIDVAGPFEGNLNDAQILEHILKDKHGICNILKEGDSFILDRGFRDVKSILEEKGFKVRMPSFKKKNTKQLTTEESNNSRYVTKIRWVVEAVHGIIAQKYKLLHHQFRNAILTEDGIYCKVACLLHNLTSKPFNSDAEKLEIIIERMKSTKNNVNTLAQKVSDRNYDRKTVPFQKITSTDLLDFPEMTIEDLELFFTGSYQLKQAVSYLGEMLEEDNTLMLSYLKAEPEIVRFEVRSRHINSRTYKCYIHYDTNDVGFNAIKGYCCNCANGLRTIGCCSHVAALVYHLSYGRYLSKVIRPAEVLTNLFDIDNVCPVIDENSDED